MALRCRPCSLSFPRSGHVYLLGPPFSLNGASDGSFGPRMQQLLTEAAAQGWERALASFTTEVLSGRLAEAKASRVAWLRAKLNGTTWEDCLQDLVDPTRAGWQFLVDLRPSARILLLGPNWGAIPLALARKGTHVVVLDGAVNRLQLAAHQTRASGLGNLTFACVRDPLRLPLASSSFDLALAPGFAEWFSATGGKRSFGEDCGTELLRELRRILIDHGQAYVGTGQRLSVSRPFSQGVPGTTFSHDGLRQAARDAGFGGSALFAPVPFRHKFHQILDLERGDRMNFSADAYRARGRAARPLIKVWDWCSHAVVERQLYRHLPALSAVLSTDGTQRSFIDRLFEHLAATGSHPSTGRIRHYYVRPKGVVILVADFADCSSIIRLPLDERAAKTCARHHRALETLAGDDRLSDALRALFPKPLAEGSFAGQTYFAESAVRGESGRRYYSRSQRRYDRAISHAAAVLYELRRATEQRVIIDDAEFDRLCGLWLAELRTIVPEELRDTLDRLERMLRRTLIGVALPLGWHHGDLDFANLLYADDAVTGIVDFEVFDARGLPLLDLLFLLARRPIRREGMTFGSIFTRLILSRALPRLEAELLEREMRAVGIDDELYLALAHCSWLSHLRLRRDSWLVRSPSWLEANLHHVMEEVRSKL